MILSTMKSAPNSPNLEQYTLSSEIAAEIVMTASYFGDVHSKTVADLGCGSGILGIGALLLGARSVTFVDCDCSQLSLAEENCEKITKGLKVGKVTFECSNIENITFRVDTVVQNPPFGTRRKGQDVQFLKKAAEIAPVVYSLHKKGNAQYLEQQTGHRLTHVKEMTLPLYRSYPFHEKKVVRIDAELLRFEEVNP